MLGRLADPDQRRIADAMTTIAGLLGAPAEAGRSAPYLLRGHQPGDMGWIVHRHAVLYAREWGYNAGFEALVARICADFLDRLDPARERCWIAERDGVNVGSVFLMRKADEVAKLRLLIVEPAARGLGIGRRLVEECIDFARNVGYRSITLWTNDVLIAARNIYQQAGFRLIASAPHRDFGPPMVGEDWELPLH
jgi:GNAT superfamily N-acetyltransferase